MLFYNYSKSSPCSSIIRLISFMTSTFFYILSAIDSRSFGEIFICVDLISSNNMVRASFLDISFLLILFDFSMGFMGLISS